MTLFDCYNCSNCGAVIEESEILFQLSRNSNLYWCDECDFAGYIGKETRAKYILVKEENSGRESAVKAQKKFKKRLSPLRYPGGKSKMVDDFFSRVDQNKTKLLVSPFSGGGSIEWAMLESGVFDRLVINDLDEDVANFWRVVLFSPSVLNQLILETEVDLSVYQKFHQLCANGVLAKSGLSEAERAFAFLVNNRCSFSGIYNAGVQGGKSGDGLLSRYNPKSLVKRISALSKLADKVTVLNQDALEVIEEYSWEKDVTFVIDPPYVEKGPDLYRVHYKENHQHEELLTTLRSFHDSFPNADYVLYYDNADELSDMNGLPDNVQVVDRNYSI